MSNNIIYYQFVPFYVVRTLLQVEAFSDHFYQLDYFLLLDHFPPCGPFYLVGPFLLVGPFILIDYLKCLDYFTYEHWLDVFELVGSYG